MLQIETWCWSVCTDSVSFHTNIARCASTLAKYCGGVALNVGSLITRPESISDESQRSEVLRDVVGSGINHCFVTHRSYGAGFQPSYSWLPVYKSFLCLFKG